MENIIALAAVAAISVLAVFYIIRSRRRGKTCIGCPCSGKCDRCNSKAEN